MHSIITKIAQNDSLLLEEKHVCNKDNNKFLWWRYETSLKWTNIMKISFLHVVAIYAALEHPYFSKPGIVIYCLVVGGLAGFGVTAGAHRYYTHRSFKATAPLRIIFLICYSIAGQNSVKEWVRDHRSHHKFSETDADPHNAKRGFFFSHVGWLMLCKHPEVTEKGKTIDCSDLMADPLVVFHQKYCMWLRLMFCFIIPTIIPPFLFGETWYTSIMASCFVRYAISLNCAWAVNSFAHLWGRKPYNKTIFPVENTIVSLFAMGEGYHNYHHTFPWDYRTSEIGKYLNVTTLWLNFFEKIGWAYDMKTPSQELIETTVKKYGDGSHCQWGHQEVPEEDEEKLR